MKHREELVQLLAAVCSAAICIQWCTDRRGPSEGTLARVPSNLILALCVYEGKNIFLTFSPRLSSLLDMIVSMSVLIGYSITTASFVLYVVKEHQTKAKQLQHISGISVRSYWVTNFLYDLVSILFLKYENCWRMRKRVDPPSANMLHNFVFNLLVLIVRLN